MFRLFQDKRWIVGVSLAALIALIVLAVSLRDVQFHAGQTYRQEEARGEVAKSIKSVTDVWVAVPLWKQIAVWVIVGLLVVLVGLLLSPEQRKRLLIMFIRTALTFWALYYIFKNYGPLFPSLNIKAPNAALAQQNGAASSLPPVFEPPHVPPIFSYLISFGIILIGIWIVWRLNRFWNEYISSTRPRKSLDELAKIARSSLRDLSSGKDSDEVIVNCYLRMSEVVGERRNLHRGYSMTATEFASRLEKAGLPSDAVHRLTRLFESVRYGARQSSQIEIHEAVSCLNVILHYCGEAV